LPSSLLKTLTSRTSLVILSIVRVDCLKSDKR
jgi:hypothetical protein